MPTSQRSVHDTDSANYDLSDVDTIRERMRVSYTDARDALKASDGNIVDALAWLEEHSSGSAKELTALGEQVSEEVQKTLRGRDIADVRVKLLDTIVASLPVGAAGVAAALLVFGAQLISNCSVEVDYAEDEQATDGTAPI